MIWGEFQAYVDLSATVPVLIMRVIDSSFYEVATNDTRVIRNLKVVFRDVRPALSPDALFTQPPPFSDVRGRYRSSDFHH